MIVTTMNDIPGYVVDEVFGEVMGLTVRSRNIGSQIGAGLKAILGGELKGMTKALTDSRQEVMQRMVAEAEVKGGNAIIAMRFDTSELGNMWTEMLRVRHGGARTQSVEAGPPGAQACDRWFSSSLERRTARRRRCSGAASSNFIASPPTMRPRGVPARSRARTSRQMCQPAAPHEMKRRSMLCHSVRRVPSPAGPAAIAGRCRPRCTRGGVAPRRA